MDINFFNSIISVISWLVLGTSLVGMIVLIGWKIQDERKKRKDQNQDEENTTGY